MMRKLMYSAALLILAGGCGAGAAVNGILAYEWTGNIDKQDFPEPSGITFHPARQTLFVVGDEGDIAEISTDGSPLQRVHISREDLGGGKVDFEGITVNPSTGLLYVAIEGDDAILEVNPDGLTVVRRMPIERSFNGVDVLKEGGQGIEAVTFVPDADNPAGGTLYVANQAFEDSDEPSAIVEIELPVEGEGPARIVRVMNMEVSDLAGLWYDAEGERLYVVSDSHNALMEVAQDGSVVRAWAFPGDNQEGIAFDSDGYLYIAQDSGGILKIRPEGL